MSKKVVTKAAPKNTLPATVTELDKQLMQDSGSGFEEATRDAYAIPFLIVLQDLSPQVKKKMSGYVEGAKPGMFYNTVTKEVFDELRVIPCYFSQVFIEWIARDEKEDGRGGIVNIHPANTPLAAQLGQNGKKRNALPNGHILEDTRQHFVLYQRADGTVDQAMIGLKSTQLKVSRRWMAQMRAALIEINGKMIAPPSFAWSYKCTTEEDANDQGSWYSWVFSDRERVTDADTYARARAFCAMMREGRATISYADLAENEGDTGGRSRGDDSPRDLDGDNEIDA